MARAWMMDRPVANTKKSANDAFLRISMTTISSAFFSAAALRHASARRFTCASVREPTGSRTEAIPSRAGASDSRCRVVMRTGGFFLGRTAIHLHQFIVESECFRRGRYPARLQVVQGRCDAGEQAHIERVLRGSFEHGAAWKVPARLERIGLVYDH